MNTHMAASGLHDVNVVTNTELLGQVRHFESIGAPGNGISSPYSGEPIEAMLVKNESGGTLNPCEIVNWGSTLGLHRGVGAETSGAAVAAGVVPWGVSSVPNGSTFWLIRRGYAKVLSDGGDDAAVGALVQPAASGQVSVHSAGTNDIYACARMLEAIGSVAAAQKAAFVDFRF